MLVIVPNLDYTLNRYLMLHVLAGLMMLELSDELQFPGFGKLHSHQAYSDF